MVIAGAEVDVLPEPVSVAADDEERFAMRLQTDHAIDDVRAGFFELAGPLNVGGFVETRAQLDERGDLLAGARGVDQRFHDR